MSKKFHSLLFSINDSNNFRGTGAHRIAHVLRQEGWDCEVVDFVLFWDFEKLKELIRSRVSSNTQIFGFSCFANAWKPEIDDLTCWLKEQYPDVAIVLGSQEVLRTNVDKKYIDWYIDSFGDNAVLSLAKYIAGNGTRPHTDLDEQARSGKRLIKSNKMYPAFPMASLTQDYEDRDFIDEYEMLTVEIGRGCKFKCDFCNFPILGVKGDYTRDALDFETDMKRNYDKWGIKNYYLADETFNDRTEKIIKFADVVDKLPFEPWYAAFIRADLLVSRPQDWEHLARMRVLGQHYGIESLNHASAKSIGKGMETTKLVNGILKAREYFLNRGPYRASMSFIAGLQYETLDTLEKTKQWLLDNWTGESLIYYPLTIPSEENENLSTLSKDWNTRGYSLVDREVEIPKELTRQSFHASMPPLKWKNEHMDIFDAYAHVGDIYTNHYHKFKEIMWNFGNLHRDFKLPISELLDIPAVNNYTPEADENRKKFFENYFEKKLNYRP